MVEEELRERNGVQPRLDGEDASPRDLRPQRMSLQQEHQLHQGRDMPVFLSGDFPAPAWFLYPSRFSVNTYLR